MHRERWTTRDAPAPRSAGNVTIGRIESIASTEHRRAQAAWATPLAAVLLFWLTSLAAIVAAQGLPYVLDNNETFSSLTHARNLIAFGIGDSAGLADEAASPEAAAHPVVHTHQGNFPRLFTALLLVLGLTSVSGQIAITTLVVGGVAMALLCRALERLSGRTTALVVAFLVSTDYLLIVQWNLNTYRIWIFFFLSVCLFLAHRSQTGRWRIWLWCAILLTYACLYYYELSFAFFTSVTFGLWTLYLGRRRLWHAVGTCCLQLAGALTGFAVFLAQLVAYLGWEGVKRDIQLTVSVRNYYQDHEAAIAAVQDFAESYSTAIFHNFVDGRAMQTAAHFVDTIFRYGVQLYTPFLAFAFAMVLVIAVTALLPLTGGPRPRWVLAPMAALLLFTLFTQISWFVAAIGWVAALGALGAGSWRSRGASPLLPPPQVGLLLFLPLLSLCLGVVAELGPFGLGGLAGGGLLVPIRLVAAGAMAAALTLIVQIASSRASWPLTADTVLRLAVGVLSASLISRLWPVLFDQAHAPLWAAQLTQPVPTVLLRLLLVLLILAAMALVILRRQQADRGRPAGTDVAALIGCFLIAHLALFLALPGYLFSGYVWRHNNLLALPLALVAALVIGALMRASLRTLPMTQTNSRPGAGVARLGAAGVLGMGAAALLLVWSVVQFRATKLWRIDDFTLAKVLEEEFAGNSIVSNWYALPMAWQTESWAYLDHDFGLGHIARTDEDGYQRIRDTSYLWFADRNTNPSYERPDLFVCYVAQTMTTTLESIARGALPSDSWCSILGLVERARQPADGIWPDDTVVWEDPSGNDRALIVRLDWDFSPYVAGPVEILSGPGDRWLQVRYDFRHQDGQPEAYATVAIHAVESIGSVCRLSDTPLATARGRGGSLAVALPAAGDGGALVAELTVATQTRQSRAAHSAPFQLADGDVRPFAADCAHVIRSNTGNQD